MGGQGKLPYGPRHAPRYDKGNDEGKHRKDGPDQPDIADQAPGQFHVPDEKAGPDYAYRAAVFFNGHGDVEHVLVHRAAVSGGDALPPVQRLPDFRPASVVLHLRRVVLGVGQDCPCRVDYSDPRLELSPELPDLSFQTAPAFRAPGGRGRFILEGKRNICQVVRQRPAMQLAQGPRKLEQAHRRKQKDDDDIAQEYLDEERAFHASSLYPAPRTFLTSEAALPSFFLRCLIWTSTVRSITILSCPHR